MISATAEIPQEFQLPPLANPFADLHADLEVLLPAERLSPVEWAERRRRLEGRPWSFDRVPYARRPMEAFGSGRYRWIVVIKPAQAAGSEIANNCIGWALCCQPANVLWLQADRAAMRDYVVTRFEPLIDETEELKRRRLTADHEDNTFEKRFRRAFLWFAWPVKGQLQQRSARYVVADDSDRIPTDIDGAGHWRPLLEARQAKFEGKACGLDISSPELGDGDGIEARFEAGTRETFRVACPHCGEYFDPDFEAQANFRRDGTPDEAAASVEVVCPANGCRIEPRHKPAMLARGVWAGAHQTVAPDGTVSGPPIESSIASFRIDALVAGFASWGELARRWQEAEVTFERRQDESELRAFWNTGLGKNYRSRFEGLKPVKPARLAERAGGYGLGEVPAGPAVLTASVDVQGDRFEVGVFGWGAQREGWLIDRFAVTHLDDGRTKLDPATYAEHWIVLLHKVIWRRYPLARDRGVEVPILSTAIDTGGLPGVEKNARAFWYTARGCKVPDSGLTLIKGGNNPRARLLPPPTYVELDRKGRPKKTGPRLFVPNVNAWKDIVQASLHRREPGPGYLHLPEGLDLAVIAELAAEEKDERGRWYKVGPRNETLDLLIYADVARTRLAGDRTDIGWVPSRYLVPESPVDAAAPGAAEANGVREELPAAAPMDHPHARGGRRRGRRVRGQVR